MLLGMYILCMLLLRKGAEIVHRSLTGLENGAIKKGRVAAVGVIMTFSLFRVLKNRLCIIEIMCII